MFLIILYHIFFLGNSTLDLATLFNFAAGLVAFLFIMVTVLIFIYIYDNLRKGKKTATSATT